MRKKLLPIVLWSFLATGGLSAQDGSIFGFKGGLALSNQQWESFQREPVLFLQGDVFIESLPVENKFALFAQAGYHPKGSAIQSRLVGNPFNGQLFREPRRRFVFHNASLVLGAKQKFEFAGSSQAYYILGVRGDYTVDTNLDEFQDENEGFAPIFPIDDERFIRRFNYGITVGGGWEFQFSEFVGGMIELSFHPDLSLQYEQPAGTVQINNPQFVGQYNIPQRRIRNLALELSIGLRFLRKVVYVD
jgi:hypothetical protein